MQNEGCRITFKRMFLRAWRISFIHPDSGEAVTLKAALPQECANFQRGLQEDDDDETLPAGIGGAQE